MKTVQFFSDDYLAISRKSSPTQIATFLDDYRTLQSNAILRVDRGPTKLISVRLPVRVLSALKSLSKAKQVPYQTLMKEMIERCLKSDEPTARIPSPLLSPPVISKSIRFPCA